MQNKKNYFIWVFLFSICVFAALNRHSRSKPFHYSSQIMSDKAGYYVYLPALFLYDFNSSKFPHKTDSLTGYGFYLDPSNNKIQSKYPVGVAVFISPFFVIAHGYAVLSHQVSDGFSMPYQNAIDFAGVFYLLLGLYFLHQFLLYYCHQKVVWLSLASIFLGSNLYYYAIFESGYSHVYTFFLFSAWLYFLKKFEETKNNNYWLSLFAIAACIILVRQINVVFILLSLGLFSSFHTLLFGKGLLNWLKAIGMSISILSPQIIYNVYLTQTPFTYSYQNEGFTYWLNPKWREVILGFENGWLSTNPIFVLSSLGFIYVFKTQKKTALLLLCILISCAYIYASWWAYKLGCSYGHRGFVDIYPFLSLPLAMAIKQLLNKNNNYIRNLTLFFLFAGILFNLKYIYTYDSCWPVDLAKSDAQIFWNFLSSPTK